MEPRNFEATLGLMCKAAGIQEVGVHALRHTYATRLFEKGVDIKIISELLGWGFRSIGVLSPFSPAQ